MSPLPSRVPYAELTTLFLDAGNTLVSIDFDWVAAELAARDFVCDPAELRRAEARARPTLSRKVKRLQKTEGLDVFAFYLRGVLECVDESEATRSVPLDPLVSELVPVLRAPGQTQRLWSSVLPGVRDALETFRRQGLALVVVSNSDGTVEQGLHEQGLHEYFELVIDSHVVGFEKPDRRIFDVAVERSGVSRDQTLHVGDLYDADVVGAREADLHALLLDPFDDWGETDCDRLPDLGALAERIVSARGRE